MLREFIVLSLSLGSQLGLFSQNNLLTESGSSQLQLGLCVITASSLLCQTLSETDLKLNTPPSHWSTNYNNPHCNYFSISVAHCRLCQCVLFGTREETPLSLVSSFMVFHLNEYSQCGKCVVVLTFKIIVLFQFHTYDLRMVNIL